MAPGPILLIFLVACPAEPGDSGGPEDPDPSQKPTWADQNRGLPGVESLCDRVSEVQAITAIDIDGPGEVLGRQSVSITLERPGHVQARCVSDEDPADIHWVESEQTASSHTLVFAGLRPTHTHQCQVTPVCPNVTATPEEFFLDTQPVSLLGLPQPAVTHHADHAMAGTYTLVTYYSPLNFTGTHLALMDPEGEVRWSHELGSVGIDTEVQWADGLVFFGGGGFTGTGTVGMVDLAGNQVYKAPPWDTLWDHHAELREDGTLFGLAIDTVQVGPRQHTGFELVHWDPLTDEILWEWQSIQGVQDGPLTMEYAHANWATLVDEGDTQAAYVSLCATQQLVRIDVETKEIQWILGTGQDMALVDSDGAPLPDSEFPQCQHGVDRQGDRWLMMDNGRQREQSRGLELVLDQEAMTATLSWEWTREGWFNDILGDADYLGQDHVLLLNGVAAGLGEKPWLAEVDMPSGDIVWQAEFTSQAWVYRADRLGGCEAFANERYCPELVDELRGGPVLP